MLQAKFLVNESVEIRTHISRLLVLNIVLFLGMHNRNIAIILGILFFRYCILCLEALFSISLLVDELGFVDCNIPRLTPQMS